jgi:O-antigen ligase
MTGAVIAIVLVICYAGLLLAPHLAIHQPDDAVEPHLAGNWRGLYSHKNVAGSVMANFVIIGLFIAKARSKALGYGIAAASAIFLFFCEAKASTALLPLTLVLSYAVMRIRSRVASAAIIFAPFVFLNVITIGSLHFEAIRAFNKAVMSDPTFTGRNDIWQFALDHIVDRPWLGHGFGAFWETPVTFFTPNYDGSMATHASHAHNALLDLALTIGLIGLIPALFWAMVLPFWDWMRAKRRAADPDLTALFLQVWMFALYTCAFESVLFNRGDPQWFTMLVAMFGLRYLSVSRVDSGRVQ